MWVSFEFKKMPLDPDSLFKINIQIKANYIVTLNQECSDNTKILDLKTIILTERNYNDLSSIVLKYKGITMENDKTLRDYNIIDSKHIIKLSFNVKESTHAGPIKKFSFAKDDGRASDHLGNNNNNTGANANYDTLPLYARPREPNCCEKCGLCCSDLPHEIASAFRSNPYLSRFILLFMLFLIGYIATTIGNSVAFVNQYQIYKEYIETPTPNINATTPADALNYYCNNNANEFNRNIPRDLLNGAAINITFAILSFLAVPVLLLMYFLDEILQWNCIKDETWSGFIISLIYIVIFCLGTMAFYVTSIVYNSIILWINITNIRNYCDSQTDFYQQMIGKWSIWSYINTIMGYFLLPCICCLIIASIKYIQ